MTKENKEIKEVSVAELENLIKLILESNPDSKNLGKVILMSSKEYILQGIKRGLRGKDNILIIASICTPAITEEYISLSEKFNALIIYSNIDSSVLETADPSMLRALGVKVNIDDLTEKANKLQKDKKVIEMLGKEPTIEEVCTCIVSSGVAINPAIDQALKLLPTDNNPVLLKDLLGIK